MTNTDTPRASRRSITTLERTQTSDLLEAFGASYLRLLALTKNDAVQTAQWMTGNTPAPREDTTERSSGMTSDPVPGIANDGRRLRLRAAVIEAESALVIAYDAMERAAEQLDRALEKHQDG